MRHQNLEHYPPPKKISSTENPTEISKNPNNLILIGEVRMSLFFNRSKDINKILLSNIYKLNNLFNKYFFHFDITLYNPSTGGLFIQ